EATNSFSFQQESMFIVGNGRFAGEKSVVCIENGIYKGFGFFDEALEVIYEPSQLQTFIKPYQHNRDIQKIICAYLKGKKSDKIIRTNTANNVGMDN
ncbi:MAG: hypothetical protein H7Y04_14045, partial [Verrucomicrobia bacterium]|nr:hypothetical protein [Cytophagales bacterium]